MRPGTIAHAAYNAQLWNEDNGRTCWRTPGVCRRGNIAFRDPAPCLPNQNSGRRARASRDA